MYNSAGQDQHWDYSPTRSEYGSTGSDDEPEPVPLPEPLAAEEEQPEQEDVLPRRRSDSYNSSSTDSPVRSASSGSWPRLAERRATERWVRITRIARRVSFRQRLSDLLRRWLRHIRRRGRSHG